MQVEVVSPDEITLERAGALGIPVQPLLGLSSSPALRIDPLTAVALMFHDHEWETRLLADVLASPAFYVGALGSTRAHGRRIEALRAAGCGRDALERIRAPIGMVHRLRDPNLLAASVIAEVAAAFQERFEAF